MAKSRWDRLRLAVIAFREAYLTSNVINTDDWSEQDARRLRYEVLWAMYEQTSYRDVHSWATAMRKAYALYKYLRPIYNPAYRLGEFWKAHIFGGFLDRDANEEGAIPISTESESLRPAITALWKWSNWQVKKDLLATRGAILGDAVIQVVDDVSREKVYLDLLYPGVLYDVDKDPFGNVKAYTIIEARDDPQGKPGTKEYKEVVSRDGDYVVYETFMDGQPFAWPDNVDRTGEPAATWQEPYGFVPLIVLQHNDIGLDWGWSELHPIRAKVQEVDGIASQLSDHIRKTVDPIWFIYGAKEKDLVMTGASDTTSLDRPAPGREELQTMFIHNPDAHAEAMVDDMDTESVINHLDRLIKDIERDLVELSPDIHTASGDASGRALRTARAPVASKVNQRRAGYDDAMVRANQMAIAIGGFRGYDDYKGFSLDSYARGDLEHSIADRPVFDEDPLDQIEIDAAFWAAAKVATDAGIPIEAYLREAGWDDERIEALEIEEPEPVPELLQPFGGEQPLLEEEE